MLVLGAATLLAAAALIQLLTYRGAIREREEREFGPANVLTLTDSVMHQVEGGRLRIQVWSDRTIYAEESQRARLFSVRFTAFPGPGQELSQQPIDGEARLANVLGSDSTIELEGSVRIRQGSHLEMRGERLRYNYDSGLVSSDHPIWMRNGETVQQGASGQYSIPDELLHLNRPLVWE
jgi:LPS export ABC transporter protein LptC